jgi:hypothetical protein
VTGPVRNDKTSLESRRLALACVIAFAPAMSLATDQLAHVELRIGANTYSIRQPATDDEVIAAIESGKPNVAEFGRSGVSDYAGFRQAFILTDKSGIQVALHLPPELGLAVGTVDLGGTTIEHYQGASNDNWSSTCPDLEENKAVLTIAHYGKPGPDAYTIPGKPNGELERVFQTHHTRLRNDVASVRFTTVDLANRWVEGVATGEASHIVPKDSDEANNAKTYDWMCRPGEYVIKTEPFELKFALHINRGFKP